MGKIQGTLRISRLIEHRKCKSLPDLQIPATGKLRRFRPMWPVVPLTDKANRCGMRNVQLFRLNPNPKLFAYHHSQEAEQGDDGRRRTLHADQTVRNPYTQTNYSQVGACALSRTKTPPFAVYCSASVQQSFLFGCKRPFLLFRERLPIAFAMRL